MAVRTKELGNVVGQAGTPTTIYTVPAGRTAIVKDLTIAIRTSTATIVVEAVRGGTAMRIFSGANTAADQTIVSSGRFVVLEAGDSLRVSRISGTGVGDVWASGAELDGVAS